MDIKNNSVHAHQPYDDKSHISVARAAYPSTSGRDTRPWAFHIVDRITFPPPMWLGASEDPVSPWSRDTSRIAVMSGDRERRRRFIADSRSPTWRDPAPPRQNGATLLVAFLPTHWYAFIARVSPSRILNRFYNTSKGGLEHNRYIGTSILSKADGDILDLFMVTSKNSTGGCI